MHANLPLPSLRPTAPRWSVRSAARRNGNLDGILALILALAAPSGIGAEMTDRDLARETSDPTSDLWYLYTEITLTETPNAGFQNSNAFTLEIQPSLPVPLTPDLRLLSFPDIVLATQGTPQGRQVTGLESFSWMSALSPVGPRFGLSWGVGPYISFPAATNSGLSESLWQVGGGAVLSWREKNFVASVLIKNGWTTSDTEQAGTLQAQYNIQYFLGETMQVGLGRPRIEYTWDRNGAGRWDVPVGLDIGRMFRLGKLPVKVLLEYEYFVINESRWQPEHLFRITLIPIFPSPIRGQ